MCQHLYVCDSPSIDGTCCYCLDQHNLMNLCLGCTTQLLPKEKQYKEHWPYFAICHTETDRAIAINHHFKHTGVQKSAFATWGEDRLPPNTDRFYFYSDHNKPWFSSELEDAYLKRVQKFQKIFKFI